MTEPSTSATRPTPPGGPLPVLVGTDGSAAALHGVRWAAAEALRTGAPLVVAHASPGFVPAGPGLPVIPESLLRDQATTVLTAALGVAREVAPELEVRSEVLEGSRVAALARRGEEASLLVLGTAHKGLAERVWSGTTVTGVCARSTCPVVVVRADGPEDPVGRRGRVLVGWKGAAHGEGLLRAGLELARATSSEVVVLHAWRLAPYYDDVVSDRIGRAEWHDRLGREVEACVGPVAGELPDVPVRVEVVHGQAATALVTASGGADRLLLLRPAHGGWVHHLGATARAVLREAHCPVEVLAPR